MKITTVFFDLDGTLLLMNEDDFVKVYFTELAKKVIPLGYDKDLFVPTSVPLLAHSLTNTLAA